MKIINFLLKPYISVFEMIGILIGLFMILIGYPITGYVIILFTPSLNLAICKFIKKLR